MAYVDFFRSNSIREPRFFDEGGRVQNIKQQTTYSIARQALVTGSQAFITASGTLDVPYPDDIYPGDLIFIHSAHAVGFGATPSGFTLVTSETGFFHRSALHAKIATGFETGSLSISCPSIQNMYRMIRIAPGQAGWHSSVLNNISGLSSSWGRTPTLPSPGNSGSNYRLSFNSFDYFDVTGHTISTFGPEWEEIYESSDVIYLSLQRTTSQTSGGAATVSPTTDAWAIIALNLSLQGGADVPISSSIREVQIPINEGMNTLPIDGYRQGVEITQMKHFDAGIVKIHAGEPGHELRQNRYGMDKNFRPDKIFEELDYFNPVSYLRLQTFEESFGDINITFPIITSDNDQLENFHLDGVIEPFAIREVSSFFSTEIPFQSRAVRGTVMGGNSDQTWASDQVLTVDYFAPHRQQIPFLDMFEMFSFSGSSIPQPMNGFFFFDKSLRDPFNDTRYVRSTLPSASYTAEMTSALSEMTGSSDNYVSFKQKSGVSGWQYETEVGTDSIAFGGLTY